MVLGCFTATCSPNVSFLSAAEKPPVSPNRLWMHVFGAVVLVPAAQSGALTNCTEKHEPCRSLATHTHTQSKPAVLSISMEGAEGGIGGYRDSSAILNILAFQGLSPGPARAWPKVI